jgi:hypothetical protein
LRDRDRRGLAIITDHAAPVLVGHEGLLQRWGVAAGGGDAPVPPTR